MKKIKRLVIGGVVLVVLILTSGVIWIDSIAKAGIETGSSFALGVDTKLDSADIGIFSGRSELAGLNVSNPPGFHSDDFLKLGGGVLNLSLASLTRETVEVSEFTLTGIDMYLEKKGLKSNYKTIMDNLGRFESGSKEKKKGGETSKKEGKKFVIREIIVRDVNVHVDMLGVGDGLSRVTVPVGEIRLKDVGTDSNKGVLLSEVTAALITAILKGAAEKGGGIIPDDVLGELQSGLGNLESLASMGAESVRNLADQGKEAADTITKDAKDAAEKINEGLGDLFKKKDSEKKE